LKFLVSTKENPFLNAIEIVPGLPGRLRPVRIVARETAVTAKDGQLWGADRFVTGGQTVLRTDPVRNTADPELYMGERYGNFTYTIPVTAGGRYTATLRFCESWFGPKKPANGGARNRVFDVYCNGVALLSFSKKPGAKIGRWIKPFMRSRPMRKASWCSHLFLRRTTPA